jgi:hypothetical protein
MRGLLDNLALLVRMVLLVPLVPQVLRDFLVHLDYQ